MSSVVGTDMPAAALLVARARAAGDAGAAPASWPARSRSARRWGSRAWVRAVALPLSALAFGYWLARRRALRRAAALTAVGVATTLRRAAPLGHPARARRAAQLYFTDDHGGITALIGANPNSEGTYTRALNQLFKDVTGRSVLDEPHRRDRSRRLRDRARVDALRARATRWASRR